MNVTHLTCSVVSVIRVSLINHSLQACALFDIVYKFYLNHAQKAFDVFPLEVILS